MPIVSFDGGDAVVIQLKGSQPKRLKPGRDGHQTEWDDLLAAVVANRPYNELDWAADSTMTAILGRRQLTQASSSRGTRP
jgi:myo-inositol 2-dehydrogenase / D-chiro-inositol 1-dehydrogenase